MSWPELLELCAPKDETGDVAEESDREGDWRANRAPVFAADDVLPAA